MIWHRINLALFALLLVGGAPWSVSAEARYMTWEGMEADKGATAWYIRRYVNPRADIQFVPYGTSLGEGIAFDVPQARYRRTHNSTAFELLLKDHPNDNPVIVTLAGIIHDIEINAWGRKRYPQSVPLEATLKEISRRYTEGYIPLACFVSLFDEVYRWLAASSNAIEKLEIPRQCTPPNRVAPGKSSSAPTR